MKILIIGPASTENTLLRKAGEKAGHQVVRTSLHKISLLVQDNHMEAYWRGEKLDNFDICLFRGISPYFAKAKTLAKYLKHTGTEVIDRELYSKAYEFDKMFMTFEFFQKGLPFIDTFHFSTYEEFSRYLSKIPRPVLIKDIAGMHSRNVFSFKTKKGLEEFFSKNKKNVKNFLIQRKVEEPFYYRVLVVGDKALGAMKRMTYFNPERKKIPLAKRSVKAELTSDIAEIAIKASKATNSDISGVDLILENGEPKLLEVNRSPKFKRFTQVVGIDVAKEIIKYLESFVKA
jgi:ribosomal protein S6--L-glutamate ligase